MTHSFENRSETLKPGQPVFLLGYHDHQMRLPFVESYIYIGRNLRDQDKRMSWHFQRAEAFLRNPINDLQYSSFDELLSVDREGLGTLVDWKGLVAELTERMEKGGLVFDIKSLKIFDK
ncbi:MAG: hypothetical protein WAT33_08745 [Giesbergeria sp.]|jgi:hypothetical protein